MTYQPNIPLATDLISVSQQDINNNFTSLGTAFDVNHIDFNAAGAGKHKWCTFPDQTNSPGTSANEVALYSKSVGGISQLFLQRESLAPGGADIQLTYGNPISSANGTSFLPGGIRINWGSVSGTVAGTPVVFATAFASAVYAVTLGNFNTSPSTQATFAGVSTTGMTIYSTNVNAVYYIAIGL